MNRNRWYWTLQIIGWTLYAIIGLVINGLFMETGKIGHIIFVFFSAAIMLFTTHLLRTLIKKYEWMKLSLWKLIVRILPIVLGASIVINLINSYYLVYISGMFTSDEFSVPVFFLYVFQTSIYFSLWLGIYFGVYFFRNYKSEEIEKWKLQSAVKDAELIALKAQINPHFLFNALNNIRALILEDSMKARDMVSHLSDLLRYSIQFNDREKVSVAEELEIVNNYLELESIHYEKRLTYQVNAEEEIKNCLIPPMIIQLLVENAIKHGISHIKEGGEVIVNIKEENASLKIEVSNTGELKKKEREGIGIRNATERIKLLFEEEPDFSLYQEGAMVKSKLILPLAK